jgi:glycerol-3-phosphate dehydrogenase
MPAIPGCDEAFLFTAPQDGRVYFVIPWYGRTLLGTTESQVTDPSEAKVTDVEVRYLLDAARAALPQLDWRENDIVGSFAGVRTLQEEEEDSLAAVSREFVVLQPRPRLIAPIGGKYTTSRYDSIEIVDKAMQVLGRGRTPSRTHEKLLPGSPTTEQFDAWLAQAIAALCAHGVQQDAARTIALRHGTRVERLLALIAEDASLAQQLDVQAPFLRAEVVLAVRDEMARSIDDVLRRRIPLSLLGPLSAQTLDDVSRLLARELHWDEAARTAALQTLR